MPEENIKHLKIPLALAVALEKAAHLRGDVDYGAWAREAKRVLREAVKED
jgi:hypothetical protein